MDSLRLRYISNTNQEVCSVRLHSFHAFSVYLCNSLTLTSNCWEFKSIRAKLTALPIWVYIIINNQYYSLHFFKCSSHTKYSEMVCFFFIQEMINSVMTPPPSNYLAILSCMWKQCINKIPLSFKNFTSCTFIISYHLILFTFITTV